MNLTEQHKQALNQTLELAKGIQIVEKIMNPRKECSRSKVLVGKITKEILLLTPKKNISKSRNRQFYVNDSKKSESQSTSKVNRNIYKRRFSDSIKSINSRLMQSKAGQNTMGRLITDHNLPFNDSIEKSISRTNTPNPKNLPFVSVLSGKTGEAISLPDFQDYVKSKGSNYLNKSSKNYLTEEILNRLQQASDKISKFPEFFEAKTKQIARNVSKRNTKETNYDKTKPSKGPLPSQPGPLFKKVSIFHIKPKNPKPFSTNSHFESSVLGFMKVKTQENQKFLDIIDKLDLDRPKMAKEKAHLIQKDREKFRDRIYSLQKFHNFKLTIENSRKLRQNLSISQGDIYMKVIEELRVNKHKPSDGELEILDFWKKMVGYGWVVSQTDLNEMAQRLMDKGLFDEGSEKLIQYFFKLLGN